MARGNAPLVVFNRGRISKLGLARTDLDRTRLSAEVQTNFIPRTLGSMMLRPGLEYICGIPSNVACRVIPFVFRTDDTALLVITDMAMYVVIDDTVLTRPSVTSALSNGTFTSNVAGWTIADETAATSSWVTGGYLGMTGTRYAKAILRQEVIVAAGSQSVEHALRIIIVRGRVTLRVGSTSGGDQYIAQTELKTGTHSLAFTPTGNFWVELQSNTEFQSLVDSVVLEGSGTASIPTPWTEDDLAKLRWDQSADVIFVAAEGYQGRRIERRAARSWSVVLYEPDDGPFRSPNTLTTRLSPSGLTGDVALTADRPTFDANHVGALYRVTSIGQQVTGTFTGTGQWSNGIRVSGSSDERQFDVLITSSSGAFDATVRLQKSVGETGSWSNVSGSTYGSSQVSTYTDGLSNQVIFYRIGIDSTYSSGTAFGTLTYASGGLTGIGRVTAVAASTSATVSVLTAFGSTAATETWEEGEWSDYRGFPTAVALHDGRLCWAGKSKVWGSVSDAYESFDPDTEGDAGPINRSIGSGPVDIIEWMVSLGRLLIGTQGREIQVKTSSLDEPITPTNFNLRDVSTQGSANVQAVKIDKRSMFVQQGGTRLMETGYSGESLDYETADRTLLVPEMGEPSLVRLAVQRQPDTRIHCVRSDGTVALLVSDPAENVVCWIDIETDGEIEDVAVLPGDVEDAVYYVVKRTLPGSPYWVASAITGGDGTLDAGAASTTFTGAATETLGVAPDPLTEVGDFMLAEVNPVLAHLPTAPAGWKFIGHSYRQVLQTGGAIFVFGKFAEAGDLGVPQDFTLPFLTIDTLAIHTFRGVHPTKPIDIVSLDTYTDTIADGGTITAGGFVTQTANTLLVAMASINRGDGTAFTSPAGMTERTDFGTATGGVDGYGFRQTMATASGGAAGTVAGRSFTVSTPSGDASGGGFMIALASEATTGGDTPVPGAATTATNDSADNDVTITTPAVADGTLLVAIAGIAGTTVMVNPTGWTLHTQHTNRAVGISLLTRTASGEPNDFTWSGDSPGTEAAIGLAVAIFPVTGFDPDNPIHAAHIKLRPFTSNTEALVGALTSGRDNSLHVQAIMSNSAATDTVTAPGTGETAKFNFSIATRGVIGGATREVPDAWTEIAEQTWTTGLPNDDHIGLSFFIGPDPASGDNGDGDNGDASGADGDGTGTTVRYIEKWALESEARGGATNKIADSFAVFNSSDATTMVTGATHLIAATVVAWGSASSGIDLGSTFVVGSTGDFTIGTASTTVIYGLPYTGTYKSAKLAYAAQAGTAITQKKRINHLSVVLADAHARGLRYGPSTDTLDDLPRTEGMARVSTDTVHETYDRESFEFPGDTTTDARVVLVAQAPRPVTVLGAVIQIETKEKV